VRDIAQALEISTEAAENLLALDDLLLRWYDKNARDLPWRREPTPYRVYLSEIMLQQTRIEAALPYFERFIAELPDVSALAAVDEARLLKLWEGLGYYNRARNLQKAARVMTQQHGANVPASYDALRELPGVGDYTAGAIASIAFGIRVPAVDGNVLRVLARFLACRADVAQPRVKAAFREALADTMSEHRPGDFNQALMDLGATVCVPNGEPRCGACPLSPLCAGLREGCAAELPRKSEKKPRTLQQRTIYVLIARDGVFLRRRPPTGLLPSLWEFPGMDGWQDEDGAYTQACAWGFTPKKVQRLPDAKHVFSHVEWHMRGYALLCENEETVIDGNWVNAEALRGEYAVPSAFSAFRKAAEACL
jgi:A/G-specific adenine glycosylase